MEPNTLERLRPSLTARNLSARNLSARNLSARNLSARNLSARNLSAQALTLHNLNTRDLNTLGKLGPAPSGPYLLWPARPAMKLDCHAAHLRQGLIAQAERMMACDSTWDDRWYRNTIGRATTLPVFHSDPDFRRLRDAHPNTRAGVLTGSDTERMEALLDLCALYPDGDPEAPPAVQLLHYSHLGRLAPAYLLDRFARDGNLQALGTGTRAHLKDVTGDEVLSFGGWIDSLYPRRRELQVEGTVMFSGAELATLDSKLETARPGDVIEFGDGLQACALQGKTWLLLAHSQAICLGLREPYVRHVFQGPDELAISHADLVVGSVVQSMMEIWKDSFGGYNLTVQKSRGLFRTHIELKHVRHHHATGLLWSSGRPWTAFRMTPAAATWLRDELRRLSLDETLVQEELRWAKHNA